MGYFMDMVQYDASYEAAGPSPPPRKVNRNYYHIAVKINRTIRSTEWGVHVLTDKVFLLDEGCEVWLPKSIIRGMDYDDIGSQEVLIHREIFMNILKKALSC